MASETVKNPNWPNGTSVGAYDATGIPNWPGKPPGTAVATAVAASNAVTFSGLTTARSYFAAAEVGGQWVVVRFHVGAESTRVPVFTRDLLGGQLETMRGELTEIATDASLSALIDEKITAGAQPLDADLSAIAALSTTAFGRALLELANASAGRSAFGLGSAAVEPATAFQPSDTDLTSIAGLSTQPFGRELLTKASAASARTALEVDKAGTTLPVFNVKAYGAKGDGATDDATAIGLAIAAAEAAGGGIVYFPAGTYIVGTTVTFGNDIRLVGDGWTVSIIKAKNSSNIVVLEGKNYATTGVNNGAIEHLMVDGNKANNTTTHGIKLQAQNWYFHKVIARNCDGHGFNIKIATESAQETVGLDNCFSSCRAIGCEDRGFNIEAHDTTLIDCQAIQCKEYGFYWTVNGYMIDCHSWCYDSTVESATKTGYRLATSVHCVNCIAEGATERQVLFVGNVSSWLGGEIFNGNSKPNATLFEFNGGTSIRILDPWVHEFGTGGAFKFTTDGSFSTIRALCFDTGGNEVTSGTPNEDINWELKLGGSTKLGKAAYTRRQQLTLTKFTPGTVPNNTIYVDNADGLLKLKDNLGTTRILGTPSEEEIASAGTIAPGARISAAKVTGTTEITKITATYAGHILTIRFTGNCTIKHGENISLQGGINMQGANNNTITLVCDGTTWREMSRQQSGDGGTVASANTITIPLKSKIVKISGTAEVKKIEPTYAGHFVVFITTETAKFVDGENLKLTATTAAGTADDAIGLICDGTNWFQVAPLQAN